MAEKDGTGVDINMDSELSGLQAELSKKLFEMNPDVAKKFIVDEIFPGIGKRERHQVAAKGSFDVVLKYMQAKEFDKAAGEFRKTKDINDGIGDKKGALLAMAFVHESLSRMWFQNFSSSFTATEQAKKALEYFQQLGDQEGIARIELLIQEIKEEND